MARFDDAFVAEVLSRTDLVDLIGRDTHLRKSGANWEGLCPFHEERSPSFGVRPDKGFYKCFGCGAGGDAISYVRQRNGWGFAEAVAWLAVRAGLQPDDSGQLHRPRPAPRRQLPSREDVEREEADKRTWARNVWGEAGPAQPGGRVAAYLRARGITLPVPPSIREHPGLWHAESGRQVPVMVGAVQDGHGAITGIHRTYLERRKGGGWGKIGTGSAKKMAGACWGGAVRLCHAAATMGIAEGIETALSVIQATGLPVWAALSLGNFAAIGLPPIVREVIICADADSKDEDNRQRHEAVLQKAADFHATAGRRVRIARPLAGTDFNDMLRAEARVA